MRKRNLQGYSDSQYIAAAFRWTGAIWYRDTDVIGVGVSIAELSDYPIPWFSKGRETVMKSGYAISVSVFGQVAFNVLSCLNPSGVDRERQMIGVIRNVIWFGGC